LDHYSASTSRAFATTASKLNNEPTNIAILGAGISGLATANALSRSLPNAKITIYEAADRVGGWMRSERIDVADGSIIFEKGPRTLRPHTAAGMTTLCVIKELGLEDEILITPKTSAAAQNRYIYYPDHLVKMPGPDDDIFGAMWALLTEPVYKGVFRALFREHSVPKRSHDVDDESIGHFLERRLGNRFVGDNIVGTVLHGIYAGDLYKLSMPSLMPMLWAMEGTYGSLTHAVVGKPGESIGPARIAKLFTDDKDRALVQRLLQSPEQMARWEEMKDASVYTFRNGMQTFSDALEKKLRAKRNVEIKLGTEVTELWYDKEAANVMVRLPSLISLASRFFLSSSHA
jgi:oxygen-dependent protoporphyrinogen oxidase